MTHLPSSSSSSSSSSLSIFSRSSLIQNRPPNVAHASNGRQSKYQTSKQQRMFVLVFNKNILVELRKISTQNEEKYLREQVMSPLLCVRAGGDEVQINSPGFSCGQRKQLSQSPGFRRVQSGVTTDSHRAHCTFSRSHSKICTLKKYLIRNQLEKLEAANAARPVCLC